MKHLSLPIFILILIIFFFFRPVFIDSKLPIPADTIIGLYHPFRDLYVHQYPNGIPYKNFLITDPVRQQYPWKELVIATEKSGLLPLWNPYSFSGVPLLGSLQAGVLYPLNIIFFLMPFPVGWSVLMIAQPLLAGLFLYCYLRNLNVHRLASLLGAITFAFSGFAIAWLEWGNILHTALWLPLVLLSIDKLLLRETKQSNKDILVWSSIFLFALTASFFAGHLQIFFYLALVASLYFLARWWQFGRSRRMLLLSVLLIISFLVLTFIQWFPTMQFILQSARDVDQVDWQKAEGWFIPWQHLVQFIAPDFFGNPATLNYSGVWNYGELVGYVGLIPLLFSLSALIIRRDKKTIFFGTLCFLSLIFALPTIFAQLPYRFHLPFLSTSQPTRLLFITDFSLAILAALGCDLLLRSKKMKLFLLPILFVAVIFCVLWGIVLLEHLSIAQRNLYLPTVMFVIFVGSIILLLFTSKPKVKMILVIVLFVITVFDLVRFGEKFTPFTDRAYLFPQTKTIAFLQKERDQSRIMTTDSRILPPNFSTVYRLQSVDGYDPLFLRRYAELIAASERGKPDANPPFGFNRIITPHNFDSRIIDLLGVRYVLSLTEITSSKLEKVMTEGQTIVYRNKQAFSRTFFVKEMRSVSTKQKTLDTLFDKRVDLKSIAVVEGHERSEHFATGNAVITEYKANTVVIKTDNKQEGFLVLMDAYYPTWRAMICSEKQTDCNETPIYITNYAFRGIIVPAGKHSVVFSVGLL